MEATKRLLKEEFCGLVLTYRVNDTLLCVPVEHVESVIEPPALTEIPGAPAYVMGAFMHRGKTALALSLKKLLRLPSTELHTKKESLLVVWMGDQPIGYWVDEIKGMTDSGRGHWSAVPALIRDQGITRALVCDSNVYFPLDLTQSSQFGEIFRTLENFEKNRLHEVTEEDVRRAQQAEALHEQATPVTEESAPALIEDDYTVAEFPFDSSLEEAYEDHIETTAFAEHELDSAPEEKAFDTSALARQMYEAQFKPVEQAPTATLAELEFDHNGQADAFLSELGESGLSSIEAVPDVVDEASNEAGIDELQLDAFDPAYLEQLIPQQPELLFNEHGQADAFLSQLADFDAGAGHNEAEHIEVELSEDMSGEGFVDEAQLDAFDPAYLEMLEQASAQHALDAETIADEGTDVDLTISEEPYSYLPTSLPEDDEPLEQEHDYEKIFSDDAEQDDEQALVQQDIPFDLDLDAELGTEQAFSEQPAPTEVEAEAIPDETALRDDDLSLVEEPYCLLPDRLAEDDAPLESVTEAGDTAAPLALLPHMAPQQPPASPAAEQVSAPVLPDMNATIARADYIADRFAESYQQDLEGLTRPAGKQDQPIKADAGLPARDRSSDNYVSDLPAELEEDQTDRQAERARARPSPLPGGIIIRPDGQINKSFGLVKVFTIVLATSAAGAWWFRDELFHKEQIRKEIPSILQNEIAYLYSERVTIANPPKGRTRMVVDTPDEEITVIKRKYVDPELLRERRKKGVKLHRVRKGDTLWAIAKKYLADPYRYPELAENNRIHNPNLIRPGDVVKITTKVIIKK